MRPTYPDTDGIEIAGRVLVGGKPARHDVVLESSDGETVAETPSDAAGEFRFPKLSPGDYRLRVRMLRRTFPPRVQLPTDHAAKAAPLRSWRDMVTGLVD